MKPSKNRAIIFDFDGVLANSFKKLYLVNRDAMRDQGKDLSVKQYRDYFINNIHLSLKNKLSPEELNKIVAYKKKHFGRFYQQIKLYPFAKVLLKKLEPHYKMAVVSSTKKKHLIKFMKRNKIRKYFKFIFGSSALSKKENLLKSIRLLKVQKKNIVFVTDTMGDIKAGKAVGLKNLGVTWGFHSASLLRKVGAHKVFNRYKNLLKYLEA